MLLVTTDRLNDGEKDASIDSEADRVGVSDTEPLSVTDTVSLFDTERDGDTDREAELGRKSKRRHTHNASPDASGVGLKMSAYTQVNEKMAPAARACKRGVYNLVHDRIFRKRKNSADIAPKQSVIYI